jgi:hypothetical protein
MAENKNDRQRQNQQGGMDQGKGNVQKQGTQGDKPPIAPDDARIQQGNTGTDKDRTGQGQGNVGGDRNKMGQGQFDQDKDKDKDRMGQGRSGQREDQDLGRTGGNQKDLGNEELEDDERITQRRPQQGSDVEKP